MLCSCTKFFCGELDEERKKMLNKAQVVFNKYCTLENIPCETFFIDVKLKEDENSDLTSQLHMILYNEQEKVGWLSLHIYDKNGNFLLTHSPSGKRSMIAPNW